MRNLLKNVTLWAMSVLLHVEGLSKAIGARVLFHEGTFAIHEGLKIGLIGRNGAGKTTLMKMLAGVEKPDSGTITVHPGTRIAYLSQHVAFVGDETVLGYLERVSNKAEWACAKVAGAFDLKKEKLHVPVSSLSGGWQMRVQLAGLLLHDPNLLLLDEPTNYLDVQTQLLLEAFLRDWPGAVLVISHDRSFLMNVCDHTMEIDRGDIALYTGDVNDHEAFKEEQLTFNIKFNQKIDQQKKHLMEFVERFGAKATKATQAQSKLKQIRKLKPVEIKQKLKNAKIFIQPTEPRKTFAVKAKDLAVGYDDKVIATNGNFEVDRGQKVAILGENGAGKSTLLKTLGGKLEKKDGTFTWNNRMELAYYDQYSAASLHPKDTIGDYLKRHAGYLEVQDILRMAGAFLFKEEDLDKTVSVLSGGERARLVLAGILLQAPDALLLDEPTNHLDLETVETLANALSQWNGTVLFISHSRSFVNQLATRIFEVKNGEIRNFPGTYEEYLYAVSLEAGIPQEKQDEVVTEAANRKERHKKRKELLRTIQKLEKQLEDLEHERENIMKSILTDPTKIDVERDRRLQTLMTILSHTESEWLKAQEDLQKIEER